MKKQISPEVISAKAAEYGVTEVSMNVFIAYAGDAPNWSGSPLIGGNVGGSKEERGNITQLKKAGLITTEKDGDRPDLSWMFFTDEGKKLAAELEIELG
jgi:hypothetical protein